MVMSWLINSMELEIAEIFTFSNSSWKSEANELAIYRPPTIDLKILQQRAEEDKLFELLAYLKPEYEQLRSQILMSPTIPSLNSVCITIQ
ncbi:unnamed protein product [Prunus brigantina]